MPKKAAGPGNKVQVVGFRMTPELVKRVDVLVEKGVAASRTDFVKDAVMFKLYIEENRAADFTATQKLPDHNQERKNTS